MELYLQSCGSWPEHDYNWVKVSQHGQSRMVPVVLRAHQLLTLIQGDAFALVLGRYDAQLVLFVNALATNKKMDFLGRRVRHALVCVGTEEDEKTLRGIAVAALRGTLPDLIDNAVAFDRDSEVGFRVDPSLVRDLRQQRARGDAVSSTQHRIGKNVAALRKELMADLNVHQLPGRDGTLVVVTRNKVPETLMDARVWRGLSSLVDQDADETTACWHDYQPGNTHTPTKATRLRSVLLLAILVIVALVATLVLQGEIVVPAEWLHLLKRWLPALPYVSA